MTSTFGVKRNSWRGHSMKPDEAAVGGDLSRLAVGALPGMAGTFAPSADAPRNSVHPNPASSGNRHLAEEDSDEYRG